MLRSGIQGRELLISTWPFWVNFEGLNMLETISYWECKDD